MKLIPKRFRKRFRKSLGRVKLRVRNRDAVVAALNGDAPIRLELGAGNRKMDGWLSVDRHKSSDINHDLREPLPFPAASVQEIYSSHLLEHFYYSDLMKLLQECHRVLRPDGLFGVCVPNARLYIAGYLEEKLFDREKYCTHLPATSNEAKIDLVNYIAYMDGHHRYMFDEENLLVVLKEARFREVQLRDFDPSLDMEERRAQSIYALARK